MTARAQVTNFWWTNTVASATLALSSNVWTNSPSSLPLSTLPLAGGSSNYSLFFGTTSGLNQTITNDLGGASSGGGFTVNRLIFSNPILTFFGSNFVMAASGTGALPTISNTSARLITFNNGFVFNTNTVVATTGTGGFSFNGAVSGSGALIKIGTGAGVVLLTNVNSYSGGTFVNQGILRFDNAASIGGSARDLFVSNGAVALLNFSGVQNALANRVVANSGGILALGAASAGENADFAAAGLTNAFLGAGTGFTVVYSGAHTPFTNTFRLANSGGNLILTNQFAGNTNFLVSGLGGYGGNVILSNANNSFAGAVSIVDGGNLWLPSDGALGNAANVVVLSNATAAAVATLTAGTNITLNPSRVLNLAGPTGILSTVGPTAVLTLDQQTHLSGSGLLQIGAAGSVVALATNQVNWTGTKVIIGAGTLAYLRANDGIGLSNNLGLVFSGGVLEQVGNTTFTRTNSGSAATPNTFFTVNNQGMGWSAIGGTQTVNIASPSGWVMAGANSGSTNGLNNGTGAILFGSPNADGMVDFANGLNLLNAGKTLTVTENPSTNSDIARVSGKILGTGSSAALTKSGAGTLWLANTGAYGSGKIILSAGVLRAKEGVGLASDAQLLMNGAGGILEGDGAGTFSRALGTGSGQLVWTNSSGFAAWGGKLTVNLFGDGRILTWSTNGGTAQFLRDADVMYFGSSNADSEVEFVNRLNLSNGVRTVSVIDNPWSAGDFATLSGAISNGALVKAGAGRLVISSTANGYAGGTTNSAGTLVLGANNVLGSGPLVLNGGALQALDSGARTLTNTVFVNANAILGANGTGDLLLDGLVNLGGTTRTLTVSNTFTTFSGPVTNVGVTKAGPGTLVFNAAYLTNIALSANGGTLQILGGDSSAGIGLNGFGDNTTLLLGGTATLSIAPGGTKNFRMSGANAQVIVTNSAKFILGATGGDVQINETTGTSNAVIVTSGGQFVATNFAGANFIIGANSTGARFWVLDGAQFLGPTGTTVALGNAAGANFNNILVSGIGSVWSNYGNTVGQNGSGNTFVLTNGAVGNSYSLSIGAVAPAVSNRVVVADSIWGFRQSVTIGSAGAWNEMLVLGTSSVNSVGLILGGASVTNASLTVANGGAWTLSAGLTMGGNGAVDTALRIADGGSFSSASASVMHGSNGSIIITGAGSVWTNNGVLTLAGTNNTFSVLDGGSLAGSGSLVLNSFLGQATLDGPSSYSGNTTNTAGTLLLGADHVLGSGTLVLNGGALAVNGDRALSNNVILSTASVVDTTGGSLLLSGTLTNSAPLAKLGSGALILSGSNFYSGPLTVSNGQVVAAGQYALQNSTVSNLVADGLAFSNGNAFSVGGIAGAGGTLSLVNLADGTGVALTVGGNNASSTFRGALSGGTLTKAGSGTLTLGPGASIDASTPVAIAAGNLALAGGTLVQNTLLATNTVLALTANMGTLGVSNGFWLVPAANYSLGSSNLQTFTLNIYGGTSNYVGAAGVSVSLGAGSGMSASANFLGGTSCINSSGFSVGAGAGSTGFLNVAGANTLLQVTNGRLVLGAITSSWGYVTVSDNARLQLVSGSGSPSLIAGSGSRLVVDGGGLESLTSGLYFGRNTTNAEFMVTNGGVAVIGHAGLTMFAPAGGQFGAWNSSSNRIVVTGNGSMISNSGSSTYSTQIGGETNSTYNQLRVLDGGSYWIVGTGGLGVGTGTNAWNNSAVVAGNGSLLVTPKIVLGGVSPNSTNNSLAVSGGGTVVLGAGGLSVGVGGGVASFDGAILRASAASPTFISNGVSASLGAGGLVLDDSGFNLTLSAALTEDPASPGGGFTKVGSGTVLLSNNNTWTGGTVISNGVLQVGAGGTVGSLLGPIENHGLLLVSRSDALALGGAISGDGSLVKSGAGTLTLSGANSYTGSTIVSNGVLQVGAGGTSGWVPGDVTTLGSLVFNRSDDVTFSNRVTGLGGALVQAGSGTLTFTGVATNYSLTNAAGTFVLDGGGSIYVTNGVDVLGGANLVLANGTINDVSASASALRAGGPSSGTITLAGPGALLMVTNGTTRLGQSAAGTLVMSNGTFLTKGLEMGSAAGGQGTFTMLGGTSVVAGALYVGSAAGSTGTLSLAGAGTVFNVTNGGTFYLAYNGAVGTLVVSNGATLAAPYTLDMRGSHNQALIDNATVNVGTLLFANYATEGNTWLLQNGAQMAVTTNLYIAYNGAGSNNVLRLQGGSSLDLRALQLGGDIGAFNNQLLVQEGSKVRSTSTVVVGMTAGAASSNLLEISGADSSMYASNATFRMHGTNNVVRVAQGGALVVSGGADLIVGQNAAASGNLLLVEGSGSVLSNANTTFYVNYSGSGNRMVVSNGGLIYSSGSLNVGSQPAASAGEVLVGPGGALSVASVVLGAGAGSSNNALRVRGNGASFTDLNTLGLGTGAGSFGNLFSVEDGGSATLSGLLTLGGVSGSVLLTNGGVLLSSAATTINGTNGAFTVTGSGSVWTNNALLTVAGTNSAFSVLDGGKLAGTGSLILNSASSRATLSSPGASSGNFTNTAGVLLLGADQALGSGTLVLNGGAIQSLDGSARTLSNAVSITAAAVLGADGTGDLLFTGNANLAGGTRALTVSNVVTTFSGLVTNVGVTKGGPGTLVLNSAYLTNLAFAAGNAGAVQVLGGTLSTTNLTLGGSAADTASLLLSGAGTVVTNRGALTVGNSGSLSAMTVSNGAAVYSRAGFVGANAGAHSNVVTVAGAGSRWLMNGATNTVGVATTVGNSLSVLEGGAVSAEGMLQIYGANGLVQVSGSNSSLSVAGVGGSGIKVGSTSGANENQILVSGGARVVVNGNTSLGDVGGSGIGAHSNLLSVSGSGTVWSNVSGSFNLGSSTISNSFNRLFVADGAKVYGVGATLGNGVGANSNAVFVSGAGSLWALTSTLNVGNAGSFSSLDVTSGAVVVSADTHVGSSASSAGNRVLVSGAGSTLTNTSTLYVGEVGSQNTLVVSDGGRVVGTLAYVGYGNASVTNNAVLVTGSGSLWTNTGALHVGYNGVGNQMTVANGGVVVNGMAYISGGSGSPTGNSVLVTDSGSRWVSTSNLYVGAGSTGLGGNRLDVTNGGQVLVVGTSYVGNVAGAVNNAIVVSGSGSLWTNLGNLYVGAFSGANQLLVTDGGRVSSLIGSIGDNGVATSNNTVLVTGSGSLLLAASNLNVGNVGAGNQLTIAAGGRVQTGSGLVGGQASASNNAVTITGPDSTWANDGAFTMGNVGFGNTLAVTAGAKLTSTLGYVGRFNSHSNLAVISDAGSIWVNSGALVVGSSTAVGNTLLVSNGAALVSAGGSLGGSNSALVVTGSGSAWTNQGTLVVTGFNNALSVLDGAVLAGTGGVTVSAGRVVYEGANTYAGGTLLSGGSLVLANALALQNSTLTQGSGLQAVFGGGISAFTLGGLAGNVAMALTNADGNAIALTVGNNDANTAYAGALTGEGRLAKVGSGTLALTGTNAYSGGTLVSGGVLLGNTASLRGAITNHATVAFSNSVNGTFAGAITGSGGLVVLGSGPAVALTFTNQQTYSGATVLQQGALVLAGSLGVLSNSASVTIGGGASLRLDNSGSVNLDRVAGVPVTLNGGSLVTLGGGLNSLGALIVGTGSSVVSNDASSILGTSLSRAGSGTVNFTGSGAALFGSQPGLSNAIIPWAFVSGADFATHDGDGTAIRAFSDYSPIFVEGANVKSTYANATGGMSINTLVMGTNLVIATGQTLTNASGTLLFSGAGWSITNGTLAFGAEGLVQNDNAATIFSTVVASNLVKSGAGALAFQGNWQNPGTLSVNQGAFSLGNGGSVTGGAVLVNAGAFSLDGGTATLDSLVATNTVGGNANAIVQLNSGTLNTPRGSLVSVVGDVVLGSGGTVTWNMTSGTNVTVATSNIILGASSGGRALVNVSGSGTVWSNSAGRYLDLGMVDGSSGNTIVVSDGGRMYSGNATIGGNGNALGSSVANSSNSVVVTGSGSSWDAGAVIVGTRGTAGNLLLVTNGAIVRAASLTLGNTGTCASNDVVVTDLGSRLLLSGDFNVNAGMNNLAIVNGGYVSNAATSVGASQSETGIGLLVAGAGSTWIQGGAFSLYQGPGNLLVVSNGATMVTMGNATVGAVADRGNNNLAIVADAGSRWTVGGSLLVGNASAGNRLVVSNGAAVTAGAVSIGDNTSTGNGNQLFVQGGSSLASAGVLNLGVSAGSSNQMWILDGGVVSSLSTVFGGSSANSSYSTNNFVVVAGSGSVWSNATLLKIGGRQTLDAQVTVSNRGTLYSAGTVSVGDGGSNYNGRLLVADRGLVYAPTSLVMVANGAGGSGNQIIVTNGGRLVANTLQVGQAVNSPGSLLLVSGPGSLVQLAVGLGVASNANGTINPVTPKGLGDALLNDGGVLEANLLVGGKDGTGTISNLGGVYQFTTAAPTITPNTAGAITLTDGTVSFRAVDNASPTVDGTTLTNVVYEGANLFQLNAATNAAGLASYNFNVTGQGTNYAGLVLTGTNPLWRSGSLFIGSSGQLLVSNASGAAVSAVTTNLGAVRVVSAGITWLSNVVIGAGNYVSQGGTNTFTAGGTRIAAGASFVADAASTVSFAGTFTNQGTAVFSNAMAIGASGTWLSTSGSAVNAFVGGLLNQGNLRVYSSSVANIGGVTAADALASTLAFTNASGGVVTLSLGGTVNASTNAGGVVNFGTITTLSSTLATINGSVLNETGGLITAHSTSSSIYFDSMPTNRGTVAFANSSTSFIISNGDVVNEGIIYPATPNAGSGFNVLNGAIINSSNALFHILGGGGLFARTVVNREGGTMILSNVATSQSINFGETFSNQGSVFLYSVHSAGNQSAPALNASNIINSGRMVASGLTNAISVLNTSVRLVGAAGGPSPNMTNLASGVMVATNGAVWGISPLSEFWNLGTLTIHTNSTLGLGISGSTVISVAMGSLPFRNEGAVQLAQGVLGVSFLTNAASGTVSGAGDIGRVSYTNLVSGSQALTSFVQNVVVKPVLNLGTLAPNGLLNAGAISNASGARIVGVGEIASLIRTNWYDGETLVVSNINTGGAVANLAGGTVLADAGTLILRNGFLNGSQYGVVGATNGGLLQLGDGTLGFTNFGSISIVNGSVAFGQVINSGSVGLQGGVANYSSLYTVGSGGSYVSQGSSNYFNGGLLVSAGGSLVVSNGRSLFTGGLTNLGSVSAVNADVTYGGPVVLGGLYSSDPSTNTFASNVIVTASGALAGGLGDLFAFQQSLVMMSTNRSQYDLSLSSMLFTNAAGGSTNHVLDLTGSGALDVGANWTISQLATNFSLGKLQVAVGNSLQITGGIANAFYVGMLDLGGLGTNSLALALDLDVNLYYDPNALGNEYLEGLTYDFDEWTGSLAPLGVPIPEPSPILAVGAGLAVLALLRRRMA